MFYIGYYIYRYIVTLIYCYSIYYTSKSANFPSLGAKIPNVKCKLSVTWCKDSEREVQTFRSGIYEGANFPNYTDRRFLLLEK